MAVLKSMNRRVAITYCIGIMLDAGLVLASDSRTHAGVDNFASFCKVSVFERAGDRVIILLSSGNLATPRLSGS
jgi:putative proteasome-type protease